MPPGRNPRHPRATGSREWLRRVRTTHVRGTESIGESGRECAWPAADVESAHRRLNLRKRDQCRRQRPPVAADVKVVRVDGRTERLRT